MNWPIAISVTIAWLGLMVWLGRTCARPVAISILMTSGYLLLPVPVDLPLSEVFGLKSAVVTFAGGIILLISKGKPCLDGLKIKWWDLFMPAWLLVEVAAEILNRRPVSSTAIVACEMFVQWLGPYLLGRIVLRRTTDFIILARLVVIGGLILTPLALYESIYGPYIHKTLYGIALISAIAPYRLFLNNWGPIGFRPMLFFEGSHLASSFYFGAATVVQMFLIAGKSGAFKKTKWNILTLLLLLAIVVDSRAFLGLSIVLAGMLLLLSITILRIRLLLICMLLGLPTYVALRASGTITTPDLTGRNHADPFHKNYSLWFRMYQEDVVMQALADRHAEFFGLGNSIPGDQDWRQYIGPITGIKEIFWIDSVWVWLLVRTGWIGLAMGYLAVAAPMMAAVIALPPLKRSVPLTPAMMACIGMISVVGLDLMDWIMNSHQSTLWAFTLGGLASNALAWRGAIGTSPQSVVLAASPEKQSVSSSGGGESIVKI